MYWMRWVWIYNEYCAQRTAPSLALSHSTEPNAGASQRSYASGARAVNGHRFQVLQEIQEIPHVIDKTTVMRLILWLKNQASPPARPSIALPKRPHTHTHILSESVYCIGNVVEWAENVCPQIRLLCLHKVHRPPIYRKLKLPCSIRASRHPLDGSRQKRLRMGKLLSSRHFFGDRQ